MKWGSLTVLQEQPVSAVESTRAALVVLHFMNDWGRHLLLKTKPARSSFKLSLFWLSGVNYISYKLVPYISLKLLDSLQGVATLSIGSQIWVYIFWKTDYNNM